ncbi:MAG: SOS response-associated peptidase [Gammaproteobacteria bacterium]|jgi:putative SOS response-associated peptidase YedK|nr:SOS response-associated peptidase [Gammaproteobacteria bacterium]
MCGRYSLAIDGETLVEEFGVTGLAAWAPRYNIAPSQVVPAIVEKDGSREAANLHWGLVPGWAKDKKISSRLINARAETVATKPAFGTAFCKRRCLLPADGYYEWAKQRNGKQPYYIFAASRRPFAFAGLWEQWSDANGYPYLSCSIITCEANGELERIHHRMPVVVAREHYATWLDDGSRPQRLVGLLKPTADVTFSAVAVSTFVNSPAHEGPDCIKPRHP